MTAPFGHEGPRPVQHRCRTCRGPVETYRPTGTRKLRAKRHDACLVGAGWYVCLGSYGPVDADAGLLGGAR